MELIKQVLLAWFDEEEIKSQYQVLNYRLDYFIPSLQIIIEYDEKSGHKDKEKDNERMDEITQYLFDKWKVAESKEDYEFYNSDEWYERERFTKPSQLFTVIRIEEGNENEGLSELFKFLVEHSYCTKVY